jgi:hypothetical protein
MDLPLFRVQETHTAAEQRGLSAPVGAEKSAYLTWFNAQGYVIQDFLLAIGEGKAAYIKRPVCGELVDAPAGRKGMPAKEVPQAAFFLAFMKYQASFHRVPSPWLAEARAGMVRLLWK